MYTEPYKGHNEAMAVRASRARRCCDGAAPVISTFHGVKSALFSDLYLLLVLYYTDEGV